jgi:hypothetical protein
VAAFDSHSNFDELRHFCGDVRIVDLNFAAEFFLPFLPSSHPKNLWEYLYGKKRDRVSFDSEEMVGLSLELAKHISGVLLNDIEEPRAVAIRHHLEASHTLFGTYFTTGPASLRERSSSETGRRRQAKLFPSILIGWTKRGRGSPHFLIFVCGRHRLSTRDTSPAR